MSVELEPRESAVTRIQPRAGVIGLGQIGGGVAVSLARSGRPPVVYDVRPDAADELDGVPAVETSAAQIARDSDVVLIAVVDADQVRGVLRGEDGVLAGAQPGLIVVVLSTLSVPEVRSLAEECAAHGVTLLDCGVTPGDMAADNGMVAMVGGDDHSVRRAMPVLADFAKRVVHCGPLGAGMATKIARNVITYGNWRVAHEAATLAEAAGVDPATLIDVVREADPDGAMMFSWLNNRTHNAEAVESHGEHVLRLMDKDLAAAQQLAGENGVETPLVDVARTHGADTLGVAAEAPVEVSDRTARGLKTMAQVYGTDLAGQMPTTDRTPMLTDTVDHLFGEVWSRPGLSIRDRRLLVMGATAALGRADLIEVQARGALLNSELSAEELQEASLQLHYYVGWGNGTKVQEGVNAALASLEESDVVAG